VCLPDAERDRDGREQWGDGLPVRFHLAAGLAELADCFAGRIQKFEPIPGADPEKIAGQILRTWDTWKQN
jgi:hypothetical protein